MKLHGLLSDNHNPSLGNHLRLLKPIAAWLKLLELIPGFVKFESAAPQVNPRLLLNDNKAATLTASKGRLHAKNRHNVIFLIDKWASRVQQLILMFAMILKILMLRESEPDEDP